MIDVCVASILLKALHHPAAIASLGVLLLLLLLLLLSLLTIRLGLLTAVLVLVLVLALALVLEELFALLDEVVHGADVKRQPRWGMLFWVRLQLDSVFFADDDVIDKTKVRV